MVTRGKNIFLKRLDDAIIFSKLPRFTRLTRRPLFTLSRALVFRLFSLIGGRRAISVRGKTFWGAPMELSIPDGDTIFQCSFFNFDAEIKLTRFFIKNLKPDDVFFDIGSYFGFYSLLAANFIDKPGSIHAFEPTPRTFSVLEKNCRSYNVIRSNQLALWDNNGEIEFYDLGPLFSVCNTYSPNMDDEAFEADVRATKRKISVRASTIDAYVDLNKVGKVDVMKVDVERSEPFVLRGARETIMKFRPIISVEILGTRWGASDDETISLLKSYGYGLFILNADGDPIPFDEKTPKQFIHENLVAIHPSNSIIRKK